MHRFLQMTSTDILITATSLVIVMIECKRYQLMLGISGYSIGKFCSKNTLEKPFNMYSHDGFANLTFQSNNETTGDGFSFKYRLRNKTADPLVGNSSLCSNADNSAVYISNKWPSEYSGNLHCWLWIHLGERQNLRVSVMDLDLYSAGRYPEERNFTCQEYTEVRESTTQVHYYIHLPYLSTSVSGKLCRESSRRNYIVKQQYFHFVAARLVASSSNRGFLIGYIKFKKDKVVDDHNDISYCKKCNTNAVCLFSWIRKYYCKCNIGFTGDGFHCKSTDINECTGGTHRCHPRANCINFPGTYYCYCGTGFFGNGTHCTDIDECTGGTHRCNPHASCSNTIGSYYCYCGIGFIGNGTHCTDQDECARWFMCGRDATCINTIGSYRCSCKSGYKWNEFFCLKDYLHVCANCSVNANCISKRPVSPCVCKNGYSGNGTSCRLIGNGDGSSSNASKTGTYIGGAVGGVALILIITIVMSCWCKRSRHCRKSSAATNPSQSQATMSATYIVANASAEASVMQKSETLGSDKQQPVVVFS